MDALIERIKDEPVLLTALVGAVLDLVIVFGVPVTPEQKVAILAVVTTLLALFARSQVTPVRKINRG